MGNPHNAGVVAMAHVAIRKTVLFVHWTVACQPCVVTVIAMWGEDSCSCASDCGPAPLEELVDLTCSDGLDNDCDLSTDCSDSDCDLDAACELLCLPKNGSCLADNECCSGMCKGNGRCR